MLTEKRCQELIRKVGLPNNADLMEALFQFENEIIQKLETKNKIDIMARIWLSLGSNAEELSIYWERIMFRAKEILEDKLPY